MISRVLEARAILAANTYDKTGRVWAKVEMPLLSDLCDEIDLLHEFVLVADAAIAVLRPAVKGKDLP